MRDLVDNIFPCLAPPRQQGWTDGNNTEADAAFNAFNFWGATPSFAAFEDDLESPP